MQSLPVPCLGTRVPGMVGRRLLSGSLPAGAGVLPTGWI